MPALEYSDNFHMFIQITARRRVAGTTAWFLAPVPVLAVDELLDGQLSAAIHDLPAGCVPTLMS